MKQHLERRRTHTEVTANSTLKHQREQHLKQQATPSSRKSLTATPPAAQDAIFTPQLSRFFLLTYTLISLIISLHICFTWFHRHNHIDQNCHAHVYYKNEIQVTHHLQGNLVALGSSTLLLVLLNTWTAKRSPDIEPTSWTCTRIISHTETSCSIRRTLLTNWASHHPNPATTIAAQQPLPTNQLRQHTAVAHRSTREKQTPRQFHQLPLSSYVMQTSQNHNTSCDRSNNNITTDKLSSRNQHDFSWVLLINCDLNTKENINPLLGNKSLKVQAVVVLKRIPFGVNVSMNVSAQLFLQATHSNSYGRKLKTAILIATSKTRGSTCTCQEQPHVEEMAAELESLFHNLLCGTPCAGSMCYSTAKEIEPVEENAHGSTCTELTKSIISLQ